MRTSPEMDDFPDKWEERTIPQKSVLIKEFLDLYSETATWEQWRAFLQRHNMEALDWTTYK